MNAVDGEARTMEIWHSKMPHSKLGLIVTMVSHGI